MALYWSIFIIVAVFSFLEQTRSIKRETVVFLFCFVVFFLFCLSFLRWERGSDWLSYYSIFMDGKDRFWDTHTEKGYLLLNRIIRRFTKSYTVYLFFQSGIYYIIYLYVISQANSILSEKNIGYCYFPSLLFSFAQGFAGIFLVRSGLAYMICLLAVIAIYHKKWLLALIEVLVASSIHLSAITFLVVFPLFWISLNKNSIPILALIIVVILLLSKRIADLLFVVNLQGYADYVTEESRMSIMGIIKWGIIGVAIVLLRPQKKDSFYTGISRILFIGIFFYIWCQFFSPVAQRLSSLFTGSIVFWLASCYFRLKPRPRLLFFFLELVYCFISFNSLLNSSYQDLYVPFKFVWDTFPVNVY